MKPLRLEMEAFGPYKDNTVIDFDKLSSAGIYLISGNTGSGKSYIFDGILYALFKNVSGSVRKENSIRCDFADPKTPTKVIFDFEVRGEKWHIERIIQMRSDGTLNPKTEVLTGPHGEIYNRKESFDAKIEELLGLSKKDFITIAMIAQGEFRKAMSSSTKERTQLFRNIFNTGIYDKVQTELYRREQALDASLKTDRMEMLKDLKTVIVEDESSNASQFAEAIEKDLVDEETIALLQKISDDESEHLMQMRSTFKELDEQYKIQTKRLEDLELAETLKGEIKKLEDDNSQRIIELDDLKSAIDTFDEVTQKEREYSSERESLTKELKEHEELAEFARTLAIKKEQYAALSNEYASVLDELNRAKNKSVELEAFLSDNESSEIELTQRKAEMESLTRLFDEHKSHLLAFESLDEAQKSIKAIDIKLTEDRVKRDLLHERIVHLEESRSQIEEAIVLDKDRLQQKDVCALKIEAFERDLDLKAKEHASLYEIALRIDEIKNTQAGILERLSHKTDEVQKQELVANNLYRLYLQEQAALLGAQLEDNAPCPVCGSLEHPHIAQASDACPSEDEVNKAQERLNTLLKEQAQIQTELDVAKSDVSASQKQFDEKIAAHGTIDEIESDIRAIRDALKAERDTFKAFDLYEHRLKENEKSLALTMANLDECVNEMSSIETHLAQLDTQKATLMGSHEQQKSSLAGIDKDDEILALRGVKEKIDSLSTQIEVLTNTVDAIRRVKEELVNVKSLLVSSEAKKNELETQKNEMQVDVSTDENIYQSRMSKLTGTDIESIRLRIVALGDAIAKSETMRKDTLSRYQDIHGMVERDKGLIADKTQRLGAIEPGDLQAVRVTHRVLADDLEASRVNIDEAAEVRAKNTSTISRIKSRFESCTQAYQEYVKVKIVSDVANGKLSGHKVKFETYLQGMYLDLVLNEANKRFSKMTSGRYKLVRSKRTAGHGSTGLDIDVLDTHSKKTRSASTLSGGESFKASLSLALGLSDVARMHAGGISVDCMFIDEGFGTLDDESRRSAVETLCELSQGNKSVGIISHVSELKEFIDNQVLVSSDDSGSHVKVIV